MKCKLGDICRLNRSSYSSKSNYEFVNYLDTGNIIKNTISQIQYINLSQDKLPSRAKRIVQPSDIIYSTVRPNQEHYGFIKNIPDNFLVSTGFVVLTPNQKKTEPYWLYCYLTQKKITDQMQLIAEQNVSTYPSIRPENLANIELDLPDLETQQKIVRILSALDQKIELNNKINATNRELINTIYNCYFDSIQDYCRLDEISTVTIGKTPPRNNHECFTKNDDDVKWVSISDLGKSGLYVWDTSEKLTRNAIDRYGVKMIPEDTLILSFKLTIGRTGITTEEMATNEAIAHIIPNDSKMNHYLYCALTSYNYNELGSTSSIANAINSKIVKSMKIGIPNAEKIVKFNKVTEPLFISVKNNELENNMLIKLRDTLLPKLMSNRISI